MNATNTHAGPYLADAHEESTEREAAAPALARTGEHSLVNRLARLASGVNASCLADPETYERDFLTQVAAELQGLEVLAFMMDENGEVTGRQLNVLLSSLRIRIEAAADLFWDARRARANAVKDVQGG